MVHWPDASVFAPASSQVLAPASSTDAAPFESVSVTSTCSPAAGTSPLPVSFCNVTVNVCGAPTSFVALGAMEIAAFTHSLFASGPSPAFVSPVSRCNDTPDTVTSVLARITVWPVAVELLVTWHEPDPPEVVQLSGPTKPPGPDRIEKVIRVPSGAFTGPVPSSTFTCPVRTWLAPTWFVASGGVIWMLASTTFNGSHAPVEGWNAPSPS